MALTGRFNFRKTLTGRLRLQVEYEGASLWGFLTGKRTACRRWRDATVLDLAAPELRTLIDQRFRPQLTSESPRSVLDRFRDARQDQGSAPQVLTYRSSGDGR
jgi:hypothetical protein